jgi:hypothetical protein
MSLTWILLGEPMPSPTPADWEPRSMGSPAAVRTGIDRSLGSNAAWYSRNWGQWADGSCTLEFNVGEEDPVRAVSVLVRGDAAPALLRVARQNRWSLVDDGMNEVTEGPRPDEAG